MSEEKIYSIPEIRTAIGVHASGLNQQLSGGYGECTPASFATHLAALSSIREQLGMADPILNAGHRRDIGKAFDPAHVADPHQFETFARRVEGIIREAAIARTVRDIADRPRGLVCRIVCRS